MEFVFLCFGIKASLVETLEYFFYMLVIFGYVIWVDEYIIQIDHDTDIWKIRENVVHKLLKGHRSISKTEGHYRPFKWSIVCSKDSFPFITIGNVNQMVSMAKIYLWINLSFVRWVQQIGDEWKWIMIILGDMVKTVEVNTEVQWTVFLLIK